MHSRAQISSEFFIFVGLAFLIAIAFALVSLDQLEDFRLEKENEAVKDVALKLQREVLIAASVEDGYLRVFELPDRVDSINYSLATLNSTLTVLSKNSAYFVSIPRTVGNLSKGTNIINKTGGVIYINSAAISYYTSYSVCENAENFGLCDGLDILFGPGYECSCCSEHTLCCPC